VIDRLSAELRDELAANDTRRLVDPRSRPVRFSWLKEFSRSALHAFHAAQGERTGSAAMHFGSVAHAVVLDQPWIVFGPGMFNGKEYKGVKSGAYWEHFQKEHAGKVILSQAEADKAEAIRAAVARHPIAAPLVYGPGVQRELELTWRYGQRACASHVDIYKRGSHVADLKLLKDVAPDRLQRVAFWSHYHAQLAMYVTAAEALGHGTPPAQYLIAVENTPPHAVTVLQLDTDALELGRRQIGAWMSQLQVSEESATWPAYSQSVVTLSPPETEGLTLLFNGEDVEL